METSILKVDRREARKLWRSYREHQHYSDPVDQEVQKIYQVLAQGRTVIRALASISTAGLYIGGPYHGLPKLAICRADAKKVFWRPEWGGTGKFSADSGWLRANVAPSKIVHMPRDSMAVNGNSSTGEAFLPPIPLHIRPKRGLPNYHVLWEAEWKPQPPGDPMLLRRIGQSDAWLVVGAWDLTEVERAVLATRING